MMTAAADLLDLSRTALWGGFLVFVRVGAIMALLPAFGEQSVPQRVRLGLTFAFTLILAPTMIPILPYAVEIQAALPRFIFVETVAGLALGIAVRLFILALQVAGTIAAQSTSLSQIFGGAAIEPLPAMGHVLVVGGLALAVMSGLHVRVVEMVLLSYTLLPPGQFPSGEVLSLWGLQRIAHAFGLAFTLAAPFFIASLIYNVALGVINRAMPQLMVAFVGAPAITLGGLTLLLLVSPLLLSFWVDGLLTFLNDPFGAR